ncbi:S1 family peptidase [Nonomuraea sp. NN258]|uniref:S1 family peptidase n=1 Tax=Nonomuraea antri TaxID=2730852 RepID=UPI00156850E1|nr:S1 family peptidase [Nonomuraea antri]NRQ40719.1 S1 family peptidase [Nonomuraea antri]
MKAIRTATAAAVVALALTSTPAPATASNPSGASGRTAAPPSDLVGALRRDLGLSAAQAEARLADEARARRLEPVLRAGLGERFGGSWLDDSGSLVVATVDAADVASIKAGGARATVVVRTLAALDAAKDVLDRAAGLAGPGVHGWHVDVRANDLVVLAADAASGAAFVAAAGVDPALVRIVHSPARPTPSAEVPGSGGLQGGVVRGGDVFSVRNKGRCVVAFTVRRGTTDGFLTAGRCGQKGDVALGGYLGTPIGVFESSSFPVDDYAWVSLYPGWTPRGTVVAPGGERPIRGARPAPVGSSVCQATPSGGWRCGTIQQYNTSVSYPEGTVTGLVRTSVCAQPGSLAGAPFVSGDQAQGMTSGGTGNCASGGSTYFQPVTEALSAFGLTLVTS